MIDSSNSFSAPPIENHDDESDQERDMYTNSDDQHLHGDYTNRCRMATGQFLLTLKERYKLSQAAVDFSVDCVKQMIEFTSTNENVLMNDH